MRRNPLPVARKKSKAIEPPERPMLVVSREEARRRLQAQVDKGLELLARMIGTPDDLDITRKEYYRWDDYNYELLRSLFNTEEYARDYRLAFGVAVIRHMSLAEKINEFHRDVKYHLNRVESVR